MRLHQPNPSVRGVALLSEGGALPAWLARTAREFAVQDWWVLAYHLSLFVASWQGTGPLRERCLERTAALAALHLSTLLLVRGGLVRHRVVVPLLYRLVVYGGVQLSYFMLRDLLPTASSAVLDGRLFALDERLFGVEPTLWADRFVTPATAEWFSFFYFSYFFLLAAHVLPLLFVMRRLRLAAEFAMAIFFVFCTAHVLYMVVPGYGPYWYLASRYENALPHGFFYDLVLGTVSAGGALKDIFPSLHTAAPTAIALFSWRHRHELPFRFTWPLVAFFTLNIIGATIFLRWHYAIDVVAGLALAATGVALAAHVSPREEARRARLGLSRTWPALPWRAPPVDLARATSAGPAGPGRDRERRGGPPPSRRPTGRRARPPGANRAPPADRPRRRSIRAPPGGVSCAFARAAGPRRRRPPVVPARRPGRRFGGRT